MKTLTRDQKTALMLIARNMSAIRRLRERSSKQESEQVIDIQNDTAEIDTGTEKGTNIDGEKFISDKEAEGKIQN
jgi:hypothetical protein